MHYGNVYNKPTLVEGGAGKGIVSEGKAQSSSFRGSALIRRKVTVGRRDFTKTPNSEI